jgi:hypothetical protein
MKWINIYHSLNCGGGGHFDRKEGCPTLFSIGNNTPAKSDTVFSTAFELRGVDLLFLHAWEKNI